MVARRPPDSLSYATGKARRDRSIDLERYCAGRRNAARGYFIIHVSARRAKMVAGWANDLFHVERSHYVSVVFSPGLRRRTETVIKSRGRHGTGHNIAR